jgi:hypothetical protein
VVWTLLNAQFREFRLSKSGSESGVECDADGLFVDGVPLLKRSRSHGCECWEARDNGEISEELAARYGLPIDTSSKSAGIAAVARALNTDDLCRAQFIALHLEFPSSPPLIKSGALREEVIAFIRELFRSGLIKADWNPDEHPRWPAGSADGIGGEFAPKGEGEFDGTATLYDGVYHPGGGSPQLDDGVYHPDTDPAELGDVGDPKQLLLNRTQHDLQVMKDMAYWRKKGFFVVPNVMFEDPRNGRRIVADYSVSIWVPDPLGGFLFPKPEPVLVRDVKTGDGGLTENQRIVYPYILSGGLVVPIGFNAGLAGFEDDVPTAIGNIFYVGKDLPSDTVH